jgi:hypothetical protein
MKKLMLAALAASSTMLFTSCNGSFLTLLIISLFCGVRVSLDGEYQGETFWKWGQCMLEVYGVREGPHTLTAELPLDVIRAALASDSQIAALSEVQVGEISNTLKAPFVAGARYEMALTLPQVVTIETQRSSDGNVGKTTSTTQMIALSVEVFEQESGIPTPTPTGTPVQPTPTPIMTPTATVTTATPTPTPSPGLPPPLPQLFAGTVNVPGQSVPDGLIVVARIGDEYESEPAVVRGGGYALKVSPPKSTPLGSVIKFYLGNVEADRSATYTPGGQYLNFNLTFPRLPAATPTPERGAFEWNAEAESASLRPPMVIRSDPSASGGQYISATSGRNTSSPSIEARYSFRVEESGTYWLWARMYAPDQASDAMYIGIDGSWDRVYPEQTGEYLWTRVGPERDRTGKYGVSLSRGTHEIQVGHAELRARLDALFITDDWDVHP